jgi:hypothetical protein
MAGLREALSVDPIRTCRVREILEQLDKDDRAALLEALSCRSGNHIAGVLKRAGYPVSDTTIRTHKRGDCACGG